MSESDHQLAMTSLTEQFDSMNLNYASTDADLIIISSDNTQFHVDTDRMRQASSVLNDMFELEAVAQADSDGGAKTVNLTGNSTTISLLLDIIYPARDLPDRILISQLRSAAVAADKYDMRTVTVALKDLLTSQSARVVSERFRSKPTASSRNYIAMEKYFTASSLGWDSIANELSAGTLGCDLLSDVAQDIFIEFSLERKAARQLITLHRRRKLFIINSLTALVQDVKSCRWMFERGDERDKEACNRFLIKMDPPMRQLELNHSNCSNRPRTRSWYDSAQWWKLMVTVLELLESDASGLQLNSEKDFLYPSVGPLIYSPCCNHKNTHNGYLFRDVFQRLTNDVPKTINGLSAFYDL